MSQVVAVVTAWDWVLYNFRLPIARALRDAGARVILIAPPGDYVDRLRAEGFDFEPWVVDRRGTNPVSGLGSIRSLVGIYRRRGVTTALHFTMKPVFLGTAAARLARVPAIVDTFTGLGYLFGPSSRARLLRMALLPCARLLLRGPAVRLVVQNPSDRTALTGAHWVARNASFSVVEGSGVDLDAFKKARRSCDEDAVTVFAGRLLKSKGVMDLVQAARILASDGVPIRVRILGDLDPGNPESLDISIVDAWRAEGVVDLPGHVDDMGAALADADIAVLPSEREGLPRFLLEAAAAGLPAIATDVPGNRDVVDHGVTGLLVPVGEPEELARAIARLAADPGLRAEMGEAARLKAEERYSDAAIAEAYVSMVLGPEADTRTS